MEFRFEEFVNFVNLSHRALQKIKSMDIGKYDIKGHHLLTMHYIATSKNGLTSTELCDKFREDKAAVSRYLKTLYDKGYVFIQNDGDKKYKLKNLLTDEGKKVYAEYEMYLSTVGKNLEKGVSDPKIASFRKTLAVYTRNLEFFVEKMEDDN